MHPDLKLRSMLLDIAGDPTPQPEQHDAALAHLRTGYSVGDADRRRWFVRVAAAAALVAAMVALTLLLPTTPRVDATLDQLARAARNVPVTELPEGSHVFVHSETANLRVESTGLDAPDDLVVYRLPLTTDEWWQLPSVQSTVTIGEPRFFDDQARSVYEAAGLRDIDGVGATRTDAYTDIDAIQISAWSSDLAELTDQITSEVATRTDAIPFDAQALAVVEELLAPQLLAPPDLRAALVEFVGTLDVEVIPAGEDHVDVLLMFDDPDRGMMQTTLRFDASAFLIRQRLVVLRPANDFPVPAGATIVDRKQTPPVVVSAPGERPGPVLSAFEHFVVGRDLFAHDIQPEVHAAWSHELELTLDRRI